MQDSLDIKGIRKFRDARINVELFGRMTDPDRFLDGIVRYPAAVYVIRKVATEPGFAVEENTNNKCK